MRISHNRSAASAWVLCHVDNKESGDEGGTKSSASQPTQLPEHPLALSSCASEFHVEVLREA